MNKLQLQIADLLQRGLSVAEIAKELGLSVTDVRAAVRHNAEHPPELDMNQPSVVSEITTETGQTFTVKKAKIHKKRPIRPEYYVDASGKHRWRLKSRNGELFGAAHQGFVTKQEAQKNFARNRRLEE